MWGRGECCCKHGWDWNHHAVMGRGRCMGDGFYKWDGYGLGQSVPLPSLRPPAHGSLVFKNKFWSPMRIGFCFHAKEKRNENLLLFVNRKQINLQRYQTNLGVPSCQLKLSKLLVSVTMWALKMSGAFYIYHWEIWNSCLYNLLPLHYNQRVYLFTSCST